MGRPATGKRKQVRGRRVRYLPVNKDSLDWLDGGLCTWHEDCQGGRCDVVRRSPQRQDDCLGLGLALWYWPLRKPMDKPEKAQQMRERGEERKERAVAICDSCPVELECLERALAIREKKNIWGGLLPEERKDMLQHEHQRALALAEQAAEGGK